MENKIKEEILRLSEGFDNELFKLYLSKLEDNSSYYVLLAKMLLNQKEEDVTLRKKQIKVALILLEEDLSNTSKLMKASDKYQQISYLNDLRITSEYLLSAYLEEEYLPTYLKDVALIFSSNVKKNNKKILSIIDEYYKYDALLDTLYIIFNYQGTFKKKDLAKTKAGILALDSKEINIDQYNDTLSIIAGELITKGEDYKYVDILCDFVERSGGCEKAIYFKAYIKKDSDEFEELINRYIEACKKKEIDVLDPFEIIN